MMFSPIQSKVGEPVWEIAWLFPYQGDWTEADYLALETNRLIELDNGRLIFLPMPTMPHQLILGELVCRFHDFVRANRLGTVLPAPLPVRLWEGRYCEPDIVFMNQARVNALTGDYPDGADLLVEVIIGDEEDRNRDLKSKRTEYARAGVAEYWIVDPKKKRVTVLTLAGDEYMAHGEFKEGERATSVLLDGFAVAVTAVFAAAESGNR
ncbi:MAG: Uma2 family endonuclease [Chloroflexi bacterium]|nr:Uma2 family endonuclease [Chloroflexota bacterium]